MAQPMTQPTQLLDPLGHATADPLLGLAQQSTASPSYAGPNRPAHTNLTDPTAHYLFSTQPANSSRPVSFLSHLPQIASHPAKHQDQGEVSYRSRQGGKKVAVALGNRGGGRRISAEEMGEEGGDDGGARSGGLLWCSAMEAEEGEVGDARRKRRGGDGGAEKEGLRRSTEKKMAEGELWRAIYIKEGNSDGGWGDGRRSEREKEAAVVLGKRGGGRRRRRTAAAAKRAVAMVDNRGGGKGNVGGGEIASCGLPTQRSGTSRRKRGRGRRRGEEGEGSDGCDDEQRRR